MSTRELDEKETAQLQHVSDPYGLLQEWGFDEQEAIEAYWELCTARDDSGFRMGYDRQRIQTLSQTIDEAPTARKLTLLEFLYADYESANYYEYERVGHSLLLLESLREDQQRSSLLPQLASMLPRARGLLLLYLMSEGDIEQIPPGYEEGIGPWWFNSHWQVQELIEKIGDLEGKIDRDAWHRTSLELAQRASIVGQPGYPTEALAQADADTLFAIASQQQDASPALTDALLGIGPSLIERVEAEIFPLETVERYYHLSGQALLPAYAELMLAEGRALPEELDPWLSHQLDQYHSEDHDAPKIYEYLKELPTERQLALIEESWSEGEVCRGYFGLLGEDVIRRAIELLVEDPPPSWRKETYVTGFSRGGDDAVKVMREALEGKLPASASAVLSGALKKIDTAASTELLRELLGHRSKIVRKDAVEGLIARGEAGLEGLEDALLARKKATREAGLQVLIGLRYLPGADAIVESVLLQTKDDAIKAALETQSSAGTDGEVAQEEVQAMRAFIDGIAFDVRNEINAIAEDWYNHREEPREIFDHLGLAAVVCDSLRRDWWSINYWKEAVEHNLDDPMTPWLVVHQLTQLKKEQYRWNRESFRETLRLLKDKAVEPICTFVELGHHGFLQELLEELGELDPQAGINAFLQGLQSSHKGPRSAAQEGLIKAGEAAVAPLIPFVSASKKPIRLAAIHALQGIGSEQALDALREAFESEKNAEVKAAIQSAIGTTDTAQQESVKTTDTAALEEHLRELHKARMPKFFARDQLPPLCWSSGEALSDEALDGWLSLLTQEAPQTPNIIARSIREQMDPKSLDAFGRALLEQWDQHGRPTRHRWMRWQMSVSASPEWLYAHARWLDKSDYTTLANHGSRLSALILLANRPYRSKRKANEMFAEAVAMLPEGQTPPAEEIAMFEAEKRDLRIWAPGFQDNGLRVDEDTEYNATWELRASSFAPLGQANEDITVDLVEFERTDNTPEELEPQLLRKAQVEQKQLLHVIEQKVADVCGHIETRLRQGQRWSVQGLYQLFRLRPLWSLCAQSLLFQTESDERFMMSLKGEPIDADGQVIELDPYGFIYIISPDALSKAERSRWDERHAALRTEWKEAQPEEDALLADADPLLELRALLYDEPTDSNWQAVCDLLESWPEDESLEMAITYIEAHADGHWGTQRRVAPSQWSLSLLDESNKARQSWDRRNPPIEEHKQARLRACNHIKFEYANLRKSDIKSICNSPYLTNITGLSLQGGRIYSGADQDLFGHEWMAQLTHFGLSGTTLRPAGWPLLREQPWLHDITHLTLQNSKIDWQELQKWLEADAFRGLESLNLRENPIALPGVQLLVEYDGLKGLKELHIAFNDIRDDGLVHLAEHSSFEELEVLHLGSPWYWSEEGLDGVEALAASTRFPKLKQLYLHTTEWERPHVNHHWRERLLDGKGLPQDVRDWLLETYPPREEDDDD